MSSQAWAADFHAAHRHKQPTTILQLLELEPNWLVNLDLQATAVSVRAASGDIEVIISLHMHCSQ